jgi:hypothetical protein
MNFGSVRSASVTWPALNVEDCCTVWSNVVEAPVAVREIAVPMATVPPALYACTVPPTLLDPFQ